MKIKMNVNSIGFMYPDTLDGYLMHSLNSNEGRTLNTYRSMVDLQLSNSAIAKAKNLPSTRIKEEFNRRINQYPMFGVHAYRGLVTLKYESIKRGIRI